MATAVTFYGVRGSTPCSGPLLKRYGGNTSCVVVRPDGEPPIVLDLGTGLRMFGLDGPHNDPFKATALLTHVHWDHVQGIPFFAPLLAEGSSIDLYGPVQDEGSLEDTIRLFLSPPYFPVGIDDLPGDVTFHECSNGTFDLPGAVVTSAWVPHVGPTLGYRIECDGVSVAYVSDHQQPGVSSNEIAPEVLDLCEGVDLLIHDAQYDDNEFARHPDWGHCTVDYAVEVAVRAGVGTLVLFHHDPCHNDVRMDEIQARARGVAAGRGLHDVVAAFEGLTVVLEAGAVSVDTTATVVDPEHTSQCDPVSHSQPMAH